MCMLHMFNTTFNDSESKRKLFFKLRVLYVDDSFLKLEKNQIEGERAKRLEFIKKLCESYKFSFDVINLEHSMNLPMLNTLSQTSGLDLKQTNYDSIDKYLEMFNCINKVGSFTTDFNKIMTRNLIFYYSLQNNFSKLIFANSAQNMVNNMFTSVIKGRGFSIREDIGYIDNHFIDSKITILRPMKDFLGKEILIYNKFFNVDLIYTASEFYINQDHSIRSNIPYKGNTNALVMNFFNNLQDKMSSTITTVLSTGDKLKLKNPIEHQVCKFCLNFRDDIYNSLEIGSIDIMNNE